MVIEKKRYVIMRNNRTEVLCGCKGCFYFHAISDLGNIKIKTYKTPPTEAPVFGVGDNFEVVPILETIQIPVEGGAV